ncbi:hypothetical protein OsI_19305 [Oryza sativa Indica Group]|uniref:Uncharacterized protein n=2 Tax=Oryza sativa TaxID=4530 RepID=B9FNP2_ORYSJ|nr:hypothetical protein OsI_19305 [Oryza sativa Indica Group]EEE63109.1 hypothetical protein OsJ_17917 [Oryza sativa Japonica Group]
MAPEWCRIWWPQRRLQPEPLPAPQRFVLFGWLFARTDSVDVVVGAALPQEEILRSFPTPEALQFDARCLAVKQQLFGRAMMNESMNICAYKPQRWCGPENQDLGGSKGIFILECPYASRDL